MTEDVEIETSRLKIENEDRIHQNMDQLYIACIDKTVDQFVKELGYDRATAYRSLSRGGKHFKLAEYLYVILRDANCRAIEKAAVDLPGIHDALIDKQTWSHWRFG